MLQCTKTLDSVCCSAYIAGQEQQTTHSKPIHSKNSFYGDYHEQSI